MRMKEKGNKAAGGTGPDDGIGGEWSKINVDMNSRSMVCWSSIFILRDTEEILILHICINYCRGA